MDVQFSGEMPPVEVYKDEKMKKFVLKFLGEVADIHIKDYIVADSIILEYEADYGVYTLKLEEESTGLKFLFALAPTVKKSIENGDSVNINGADGILHPLVMEKLRNISK